MENTIESAKAFLKQNEVYSEYHVVCDKLPEESKQVSGLLVAYAKSVRPDVVVPSEKEVKSDLIYHSYLDGKNKGWNECLSELRHLNPTMTFTELNHEK